MPELRYFDLKPGDPGPWFVQRCTSNETYAFDTVAGRHVLLCFLGSAAAPWAAQRLAWLATQRARLDDQRLCAFGISVDPRDEREQRLAESLPGLRHFWDADGRICRAYGALPGPDGEVVQVSALHSLLQGWMRPRWMLLSPALQVRAVLPFAADGAELDTLASLLAALPPPEEDCATDAPVLVVPEVFESALCERLIDEYRRSGGMPSGFMRERDGRTVGMHDARHKVRRDHLVEAPDLLALLQRRIVGRLAPWVQRAHQFQVSRMERYLVACYDAAEAAHFRAHRDNTTRGTAHRRFAVTINLNHDFEGGELSFPEFGPRRYRPEPGSALVFSCSLLHQVDRMRRGQRFAFLPFLYDEAAAAQRDANRAFVGDGEAAANEGASSEPLSPGAGAAGG